MLYCFAAHHYTEANSVWHLRQGVLYHSLVCLYSTPCLRQDVHDLSLTAQQHAPWRHSYCMGAWFASRVLAGFRSGWVGTLMACLGPQRAGCAFDRQVLPRCACRLLRGASTELDSKLVHGVQGRLLAVQGL